MWISEILVQQVEPVVLNLGISEFFLGVILVPLVGNVAEHMVAVSVALKDRMSLSVEIRDWLQPAGRPVRRSRVGLPELGAWQPADPGFQFV